MDESKISVRYARALFETALENDLLEKTEEDMKLILEVSIQPEFRRLTENPSIPPSKKYELFSAAFGDHVGNLTLDLASLAFNSGRERFLPSIARNYISLSRKKKGIAEVVLTTAIEPDAKTMEILRKEISMTLGMGIDLKEIVDPDIMGGFIVRVDDRLFDASVRERLKKIGKEIIS